MSRPLDWRPLPEPEDPRVARSLRAALMGRRLMLAGELSCLLCGAPAELVGTFEPEDPWLYCSAPPEPGKVRVLTYGLCEGCAEPGLDARVRTVLLRSVEEEAP